LISRGHPVRIVIGDFQYDDAVRLDLRAELERRGALPVDPAMYVDEPAASFEQVLEQLASVEFVIASRYHNVLLGLYLGKPAISLSYEAKHEALMASAGLADYCQSINAVDTERLFEQFLRLEVQAASARELIAAMVIANAASLAEQYQLLTSLITADSR
jgi:polysaccharide pyruvyl transferase WcaK-like protein